MEVVMICPHARDDEAATTWRVVAREESEPLEGEHLYSSNDSRQRLVVDYKRLDAARESNLKQHERLARVTPVLPHDTPRRQACATK